MGNLAALFLALACLGCQSPYYLHERAHCNGWTHGTEAPLYPPAEFDYEPVVPYWVLRVSKDQMERVCGRGHGGCALVVPGVACIIYLDWRDTL